MLIWDETDVMSALEVIPTEEEDGIFHHYKVDKDGLVLNITIHQYDGDIDIELLHENITKPLFSMGLTDCDGVLRKTDESGEYLQFAPSQCFDGRYDGELSIPYGVRVSVHPSISVELYGRL